VGTYCYVAVRRGRLGGARRFGAHRGRTEERSGGILWRLPHCLLCIYDITCHLKQVFSDNRECRWNSLNTAFHAVYSGAHGVKNSVNKSWIRIQIHINSEI